MEFIAVAFTAKFIEVTKTKTKKNSKTKVQNLFECIGIRVKLPYGMDLETYEAHSSSYYYSIVIVVVCYCSVAVTHVYEVFIMKCKSL